MEPIGRRPAVRLRQLLLWAWIIAGVVQVRAAHVLGGNITYVCLGGNNFQVNLGLFYDCTGVAALPQTLTFTSACGTQSVVVPAPAPVEVSQICPSQLANSSCNGGSLQGVNLYNFQITVNLPPCPGGWLISWVLCCRAPTLNLVAAPGTYVEAVLRNDLAPCTDSPQFAEQSVPYICVGEEFNFNFGVTAAPGHNLIYSLIGARGFATTSAPVNYQAGFSGTVPVPGTTIDPFSGQISFTPGAIGKYVFVVQVDQYDANGVFIGSVMRDIMLIAMPCNSVPPVVQGFATLSGPNDGVLFIGNNTIEVCHGAPFCFDLVFADPNVGDVLSISSQAATLLPGSSVVVAGTNPMTVTVCWAGDVAHSPVNLLMQVNDGACPVINTSTVGVTITSVVPTGSQPYAGLDATVQVCPTALVFDLVDELGGSPDPGGFWMAPDMSFHGPQFNPATDPPGTYLYVAGNACANDTAQLTIAFTTNLPDAGISGALNLCGIASAVALVSALGGTPDVGGAWTHQATGTPAGSLYDPLLDVPGVFVYTVSGVSGCADATATVTVTEQNAPDAGADNAITLCDQGAQTNLFAALNGTPDAGGTWSGPSTVIGGMYDPAVMNPGAYVYTVSGTAPCGNASATVTVNETGSPDAGADNTITLCDQGSPTNLFTALNGTPDVGGTWSGPSTVIGGMYDPATMNPGSYMYTVSGTAPCGNASATVTVNETGSPDAGTNNTITLCDQGAQTNLFAALNGTPDAGGMWSGPSTVTGGMYDPAVMNPGAYVYTVSGTAPCGNASATVTVNETGSPDAGADGVVTVCSIGPAINLFTALNGTPDVGGTWSGPSAIAGGMYDPSVHTAGTYTYTIAATAPCASASSTVTVTIQTAPDAGTGNAVALCNSGSPVNLFGMLTGSPQAGGTWTGPDGNVITGVVDPATGVNGSYTYTLAASVICPSQAAVVLLTISSAVDAGEDTLLTICSSESPVDLFTVLGGTPDSGGTWTQQSDGTPFGGLFDPSISNSGTYGYAMAAGAPCPSDTAVVQVIVFLDPDAGSDSMGVLCSTDMPISLATMLSIQVGTDGIWLDPAGSLASPLFDPAGSAPGAYLYILPATGTCPGDTAVVDIGVVAATVAGSNGDTTVCSNGGSFALIDLLGGTPDPGGIWTAPDGSVSNGLLHAPSALEGVYTYMVTAPAPCPPSTATVEVVILMPPVIAPVLAVTDGCAPVQVILESGYLGTGSCHWDLGNGMDTTGCGPLTYIYAQPGVHQVVLMVDPDNDCGTTVNVGMPVVVAEEPVASFSIQDDPGHRDQPVVSMINTSMGATGYLWDFGGWGTSTLAEPTFAFPYGTEERQTICLTALASPACVDTACMNWLLPAGATVFVPNAFTPDGDGRNDGFAPRTSGMDPEGFLFFIVDRWGQTLYSTEDMHASWDGTLRNGDPAPPGVYVWKLTGHESRVVRRIERTGHVTLLR